MSQAVLVNTISERALFQETPTQEQEHQWLHSQKLESLGLLAGGAAHDLNNLLTATIGYLDITRDLVDTQSEAVESLEAMSGLLDKAADLTRQMLVYCGRMPFRLQWLDLNQLVKENQELLEAYMSKKVILLFDLATPLPPIQAEPSQMQQAIMNLLTNAADAIGDHPGTISIRTSREYLSDIFISNSLPEWQIEEGPYLRLDISDTGCGMDPELTTHIFEPFYSTKGRGRGLGLSAIQDILRTHHSGMKMESQVGQGTTFSLFLPEKASANF